MAKNKKASKSGKAAQARQQQEAAARRRVRPSGRAGRAAAPAPGPAAEAGQAGATGQPVQARRGPGGSRTGQAPRARLYLDVSVVRIQEWLARTPDLKFRRGASVLLSEATAQDEWIKHLPEGTEWNKEAGNVDGVVSLAVTDDAGDRQARASAAARLVMRKMRVLMPCCHIQAVAGTGENYAAAYEEMTRARRDGRLLADSPPAVPEVILAKPCDQCRSAGAVYREVVIIASERPRSLCEDCHQRFLAAGGTKGDSLRRSPLPEQRLITELAARGMTVKGLSDDFAKMAAAGRVRQADAPTQLALVYADGNRVGTFLHEALSHPGSMIDKREIARVISDATIGALADAVMERFPDDERPPVLVHLAGGDDLLVSIPAADAWLFASTLVASFGRRAEQGSRAWPEPVRAKRPSLSAGMVFHHKTHPFSDLVRFADRELDRAKAAGGGQDAMVSFLDLTADGGHPPAERVPLRLSYLAEHAAELERIEEIPPSRRQALLALLRRNAVDDLIRRVTDLDNRPLWEVIAGVGATAGLARKTLETDRAKRAELRQLLDIARHWRARPRRPGEDAA